MSPTFEQVQVPPPPTVSVIPKRARNQQTDQGDLPAGAELVAEVTEPVAIDQPTGHPTSKVAAVGIGGGALAVVIGWLQARFGIEFIDEDIALIMLVGPFLVGYFTKEKR